MWKLTIKQEVPREGYSLDEKVVFEHENINNLLNIIQSLSNMNKGFKTEFTIINKGEDEV